MKVLLLNIFILLALIGCDYVDDRLVISNTSKKPIAVAFSNDTIPSVIGKAEYYIETALRPNETRHFSMPGSIDAWPLFAETGNFNKLKIYYYDIDTLKKYSDMVYINSNKLFLKLDEYTKTDLETMNWVMKYP